VTRGLIGMSREEDPFPPRADDVTRSLWSCVHDQSQTALLRTRDLLDAEFDSSKPAHAELLKCLWVVDHSDEEPVVPHEAWKELGFQGLDPITDIRAGGLLSLLHLAGLAKVHRKAYSTMLRQIAEREANEGVAGYYPLCTTSVNVTKRICDALLVSQPGRPAATANELRSSTENATEMPASPLWLWTLTDQSVALLHIHVLADFHARFMREKAGYMDCGRVLDDAMGHLLRLAGHCSSPEHIRRIYLEDAEVSALVGSTGDHDEYARVQKFALQRSSSKMVGGADLNIALEQDLERVRQEMSM